MRITSIYVFVPGSIGIRDGLRVGSRAPRYRKVGQAVFQLLEAFPSAYLSSSPPPRSRPNASSRPYKRVPILRRVHSEPIFNTCSGLRSEAETPST